jgi:hypothetical protein
VRLWRRCRGHSGTDGAGRNLCVLRRCRQDDTGGALSVGLVVSDLDIASPVFPGTPARPSRPWKGHGVMYGVNLGSGVSVFAPAIIERTL